MKKIVFLLFFFFSINASSQTVEIVTDDNTIYSLSEVDVKPIYDDDATKIHEYIAANFKLPSDAKDVQGTIVVTFIVEKNGELSDVRYLRHIGFGTGEEAVRILQNSKPWRPGKVKEKPVRTFVKLPIKMGAK